MGILADMTMRHFVYLDGLRRVRSDWMEFYFRAYNSKRFRERYDFARLDAGELEDRANMAGSAAANYRAHKSVTQPIERISLLYSRLRLITLVLPLIFGAGIFGVFELFLAITTFFESVVFALIPLEIWVVLMIYFHLLQLDEEFLQQFNDELRFGPDYTARAERDSELLFGYYLWNSGLCDKKKAPALLVLQLIMILSESVYRRIINSVIENLDRFLDTENFREAFKEAYKVEIKK